MRVLRIPSRPGRTEARYDRGRLRAGHCSADSPWPIARRRRLPTIRAVHPTLLLPARAKTEPEGLAEYRDRGGYEGLQRLVREGTPQRFIAAITASQLRGRGGAAFPTARKWELAASSPAAEKYVVGNGGEHEPGSDKDRHLVQQH